MSHTLPRRKAGLGAPRAAGASARTVTIRAGATVLATALLAPGLLAQTTGQPPELRNVISKEITVGTGEATLRIEMAGEGDLEIRFEDGAVLVDGNRVGGFQPGGELERAWRGLLAQAVALEDGPLARVLTEWTVPAELATDVADVAREVDRALEEALAAPDVQVDPDEPSVSVSVGEEGAVLRVLLRSLDRLGVMEDALDGLGPEFRVHVDEEVEVPAGDVVEGTLVVIEGDLRVAGEVRGDVIVIGGTVELLEGSTISGELRFADARVVRNQGVVGGGLVDVLQDERAREAELRDRLREEVRDEVRSELRREIRNVTRMDFDDDRFSIMAPFAAVARGVGGVLENLIAVLVLGLLGAAAAAFAGDNLDAIAETARRAPGRSAMVGLAGSFLLIPAWILGAVALVISIIGIPVAVAWLPLFPLAAVAAGLIGYLAVARNAGEWLAGSGYPWTGWIRRTNPVFAILGGLLGLAFAFMAANVVSIVPFLDFLAGLLTFAGVLITLAAIQVGFGAVLITRGGRRREYWRTYDPDEAWEAAMMSVDLETDPAGGERPRGARRRSGAGGRSGKRSGARRGSAGPADHRATAGGPGADRPAGGAGAPEAERPAGGAARPEAERAAGGAAGPEAERPKGSPDPGPDEEPSDA